MRILPELDYGNKRGIAAKRRVRAPFSRSDLSFEFARARRRFPDGRIGSDPSLASVEAGEKLYNAAVDDIAEKYRAFLTAD